MNALRHAEMLPILDSTRGQHIDAGLKCKPRKCQVFPDSIQYLGHIIKNGKIGADRSKLDKIREWPFTKTGNEMASFLGLCKYYRSLIPHFAEYPEPLYKKVLELNVTASEVLETAFAKVKDELCDGVDVKLLNPDKPFVVETDATIHAVGAVLLQREGEDEYPTLFYSQALNTAQRNYSTYERELLAVVKACDAFRVYFSVGNSPYARTMLRFLQSSILH